MDAGMTSKFPWDVKGVREEPRVTAREAARRSGVSVGEWLDSLIVESTTAESESPQRYSSLEGQWGPPRSSAKLPGLDDPPRKQRPLDDGLVSNEQFARVSERLDSLARELDERERRGSRSELSAVNSRL